MTSKIVDRDFDRFEDRIFRRVTGQYGESGYLKNVTGLRASGIAAA